MRKTKILPLQQHEWTLGPLPCAKWKKKDKERQLLPSSQLPVESKRG